MPRISVIIPCYNVEERLLLRCIKSILSQDFTDFEVVLVDDGSKTNYKDALKKAEKMDDRICLLTQENKGVSSARNAGVKMATGEYIIFVDADDMLVPYFISEIWEIQQETKADFIIGGNATLKSESDVYDRSHPIDMEVLSEYTGKKLKPHMVGELFHFGNEGGYIGRGPWTRLLRRKIALETPFETELAMGEDIVWNLQLLDKCEKVCVVYRIWYLYYLNGASATHKYNEKMLDMITLELGRIRPLMDLEDDREYKAYCDRVLDELKKLYHCYLARKECPLPKKERKELFHRLYNTYPWKYGGEKRYYKICSRKYKIKNMFYRQKCLFLFFKMMSIMGK